MIDTDTSQLLPEGKRSLIAQETRQDKQKTTTHKKTKALTKAATAAML